MNKHPIASVIIPTKNRPLDLQRAVRSVLNQSVEPQHLVIVDQSPDAESSNLVEIEFRNAVRSQDSNWELSYIRDPEITGLAMARNRAMQVALGDIWIFLDDDVILDSNFVQELLAVYAQHPDVDGVSGIITNYSRPSLSFRIWNRVFVRGPFHDERQAIYWRADELRNSDPIAVFRFTGAVMSFRTKALRGRVFDENLHGVGDGEDVDFCVRLGSDAKLLIAPGARLEHRHSPVRLKDHWLRRSVRGNFFLYRKNWRKGILNRVCYGWLVMGYSLVAAIASLRRFSLDPMRAFRTGLREAKRAVPLA